jgi:hypothetical protein
MVNEAASENSAEDREAIRLAKARLVSVCPWDSGSGCMQPPREKTEVGAELHGKVIYGRLKRRSF